MVIGTSNFRGKRSFFTAMGANKHIPRSSHHTAKRHSSSMFCPEVTIRAAQRKGDEDKMEDMQEKQRRLKSNFALLSTFVEAVVFFLGLRRVAEWPPNT